MKLTLTLCFFLIMTAKIMAAPSRILKCLAQEELQLHKSKNTGPVYNLNQTLINQIATIPDLIVSDDKIEVICHHKDFGPSLSLIRLMLLEGRKIFSIKKEAVGHGLAIGQLGTFVEQSPHIMFNYLSEVQALMPTAHCLTDEVPAVQFFYDRYKYLESDLKGEQLIKDKERLNDIFINLNHLDKIIKRCKAKKEAKEKAKKSN